MSESIQGLHYDLTKLDDVVSFEPLVLDLGVLNLDSHHTEETFTKHKVKLEYGASDADVDAFASTYDLEIVEAGKNEILVDIDSTSLDTFYERLEILQQIYDFDSLCYWKSRGGNFHVVVRFSSYQPFQNYSDTFHNKMLMGVVLGSDAKRAALGLKNFATGRKRPSFLFRPRTADTFTVIL